jgi:HEAT repeat protein
MEVLFRLADLEHVHTSYLLLGMLAGTCIVAGVLFKLGVIGFVLRWFGYLARGSIRTGFRTWETLFAWASWEHILAITLGLLLLGGIIGSVMPAAKVVCSVALLTMGASACLAYMFIDLERNEVERGYKSLHNVRMGQLPAESLKRYGKQVRVPLLLCATLAAIGGFAMLNQGLYETVGSSWYVVEEAPRQPVYADFLAFSITRVLNLVDILNLAKSHHILGSESIRPAKWPASTLSAVFKIFFTVVLLHQIFASLRQGKLLAETIADFWSPHEPIHERARNALPVFGIVAIDPLLRSLRSVSSLTKEQRDRLPFVMETMGPSIIPALIRNLRDSHEHVRAIAASSLGRLHAMDSLELLVAQARDPSEIVRQSVVEALGLLGGHSSTAVRKPVFTRRAKMLLGLDRWPRFRRAAAQEKPSERGPIDLLVSTLETALDDDATAVRIEAVAALGHTGRRAAAVAPKLIALSKEGDESLRCAVARSLGEVGGSVEATAAALVNLLDDASILVKTAAAKALGALGPAAAPSVPALASLLQDRDESVRASAAAAIARVGPLNSEAAESLSEGLGSLDTVVRAQTAQALGAIGASAEEAAPALVEAIDDENDRVRAEAVQALGKIGQVAAEAAVPGLIGALDDKDAAVGALAAEALGRMGESADEAIPALVDSLSHLNPQVRLNAAEALGKLGPASAAARASLERATSDEDGGVRCQAILALGKIGIGEPSSITFVLAGFADDDPLVRAAAVTTSGLWNVQDDAVLKGLNALLDDPNDQVKIEVTLVLPKLAGSTPEVIEGLSRQLLKDDSAAIQASAALALGKLGRAAVEAGEPLLRVSQTAAASVRENAMRAIAMIQPPEAAEAFAAGLKDASADVRVLASAGLLSGLTIPNAAVPALIEALRDPEIRVRSNAASAIARLNTIPVEAIPLLIGCASDPNDSLRLAAASALKLAPPEAVADVLEHLTADSHPRVRLTAASSLLSQEADNAAAGAALVEALTDTAPRVRDEAHEVFESLGDEGTVVLDRLLKNGAAVKDKPGEPVGSEVGG